MRFTRFPLPGPVLVDVERHEDDRGFFARTWCREEFAAAGLDTALEQCNLSYNRRAGTLRGMHWSAAPATEAKLVRCTAGAVLDVVVDVRPGSPTYLEHVVAELTASNHRALYVPPLFAHGFQTLVDDTEVSYQMGATHQRGTERGLRYDDPALGLHWPLPVTVVSDRDRAWALLPTAQGIARS